MRKLQSRLRFDLPRYPASSDVTVHSYLQPLYTAVHQLFAQVSDTSGMSVLSAAETAEMGLAATARLGDMLVGTAVLSEAVTAGHLLNLHSSGGMKARKASRAAGTKKPARAVALEAGGVDATIRICYGFHLLSGSFTPGDEVYLGAAGGISTTRTLVVGEVHQSVGVAVSSTQALIYFQAPFVVYARNPQSTATGSLVQDENGVTLYGSGPISGTTKYYEPVLVPLN